MRPPRAGGPKGTRPWPRGTRGPQSVPEAPSGRDGPEADFHKGPYFALASSVMRLPEGAPGLVWE